MKSYLNWLSEINICARQFSVFKLCPPHCSVLSTQKSVLIVPDFIPPGSSPAERAVGDFCLFSLTCFLIMVRLKGKAEWGPTDDDSPTG